MIPTAEDTEISATMKHINVVYYLQRDCFAKFIVNVTYVPYA